MARAMHAIISNVAVTNEIATHTKTKLSFRQGSLRNLLQQKFTCFIASAVLQAPLAIAKMTDHLEMTYGNLA